MAEKTYAQLCEILANNAHPIQNVYGQTIYVKDIPDREGHGIYDPRVLAVRRREEATATEFGHGATLQDQRDAMGWPNKDVTQGVTTENRTIYGTNGPLPMLMYTPAGEKKARPCILFFHGGGFFGGTLKCVQNPCKCIAQNADAVVLSVEYSLAPEKPYPCGFADCFDAVQYVYHHAEEFGVDKDKLGVCGDSAGANLAAACALKDRDMGTGMLRFQALLYPVTNVDHYPTQQGIWCEGEYDIGGDAEEAGLIRKSVRQLGQGDLLTQLYIGGDRPKNGIRYVSPLLADAVDGCCEALIINAEFDYLRLEGEAYGRKLAAAGVPVTMLRYAGTDHAFMDKIGEYPQAEDAMKEVASHFLAALAK